MALIDKIHYIQSINSKPIDLTLERIMKVAKRLQLLDFSCPVITVGGTNGKGTTVATLETIYRHANYKTATFTSPHIHSHTELIRLNGKNISAVQLENALDNIDANRNKILLTEFEFITLAALWLFKQQQPDIIILEIGLGGRDDAVNIIDADVAIITNVALDHCQWLGNDRESIAAIKAGIMRKDKVVILGEYQPATTLLHYAKDLHVDCKQLGIDFDYTVKDTVWAWSNQQQILTDLPLPNFILDNVATAIMAVEILQPKLPIPHFKKVLRHVLPKLMLPGRMQILTTPCLQIFDIAHNPAAAIKLTEKLATLPNKGKTYAVFSMFADKNIANTIKPFKNLVNVWSIAKLQHPRAANLTQLQQAFIDNQITVFKTYKNIELAYQDRLANVTINDRVLIFGSFSVLHEIEK